MTLCEVEVFSSLDAAKATIEAYTEAGVLSVFGFQEGSQQKVMVVKTKPQFIIPLTNSTGVALTLDTDMPGMYKITGVSEADFYISWDGTLNVEAILDQFFENVGVTLTHSLELYVAGAWKLVVAWESGTLDAATAQKINASYPLRDMIPTGTKARIHLVAGGVTDIYCRVIGI
jgi:hypothetical protein